MQQNGIELQLLVNGRPVREYGHQGRTLVEGREGVEFTLRVRNNTASRVEAVISIDGRSVLDGEPAKSDSTGYLIPAYSSYEVPGWRKSQDECAKFVFTKASDAYAVKIGDSSHAVGVIGLVVWSEKPAPVEKVIVRDHHHHHHHEHYRPWIAPYYPPVYPYPVWTYSSGIATISGCTGTTTIATSGNNVSLNSMTTQGLSQTSAFTCSAGGAEMKASNSGGLIMNASVSGSASNSASGAQLGASNNAAPDFNLGTGWGGQVTNKVHFVNFERGAQVCLVEVYYASAEDLVKVGIELDKTPAIAAPAAAAKNWPSSFKFCREPNA